MAKEIKYEIIEELDIIHNSNNSDFTIELNKVSWNGKPPQIDIRWWNRNENASFKVGKGVSLPDEAVERLVNCLIEMGYGNDKVIKKRYKEIKKLTK